MPIMNCQYGGKPGYKYGEEGFCYVYNSGNEQERKKAHNKAAAQGRAIDVNKYKKLETFKLEQIKLKSLKIISWK